MGRLRDEIIKLKGTNFFQLAKRELEAGKTKTEVAEMFQITFPTLREWLV
jgi:hypothetical protein